MLANIEKAIERLALTGHSTPSDIESEVGEIRQQVEDIKNEPVGNDDLGEPAGESRAKEPPQLVGAATPEDLERRLTTNGLSRAAFHVDSHHPKVYQFRPPAANVSKLSFNEVDGVRDIEEYFIPSPVEALPITFDRATWDESDDASLVFLTYGTPELAALLPSAESDAD